MAKIYRIYKLTVNGEPTGDIYYNGRYAVKDAMHLATSIDEPVVIWQAYEDIDTIPVKVSKWTLSGVVA